jgi:DNA-binding transcriptional LysR family regulator
MSSADRLRTFVAIYRAGSVTVGADHRGLSQPAASQQLRALERSVGSPLFHRGPGGMEPTATGRALYLRVADGLDRLEGVLDELDGGRLDAGPVGLRVGASAELCSHLVLPALDDSGPALDDSGPGYAVVARFGSDDELLDLLARGELDVAVTGRPPVRRSLAATPVGGTGFVLVGAPERVAAAPGGPLAGLGPWLTGQPWVAYSAELPRTRRFWPAAMGLPFSATLRLVAPDLRTVVDAVAAGLGFSLLPAFVCGTALALGAVAELRPVGDLVPVQPWFASTRDVDAARPAVAELVSRLVRPWPTVSG